MKNTTLLVLVFAVACGIAGVVIVKHRSGQEAKTVTPKAVRPPEPARVPDAAPPAAAAPEAPPAAGEATTAAASNPAVPGVPVPKADPKAGAAKGGPPAKEPLKDPDAREALALVGADLEAEEYWCSAINNPDLPAHERQDLIEDLNEDGLSDPKHPSREDLPLIINRILLIEDLGPYAMDQVNADAFAEAYKDLLNLADLAMGGGERVK